MAIREQADLGYSDIQRTSSVPKESNLRPSCRKQPPARSRSMAFAASPRFRSSDMPNECTYFNDSPSPKANVECLLSLPAAAREWRELGSRDIDHRTRGARVRAREAIESSLSEFRCNPISHTVFVFFRVNQFEVVSESD